LVNSPAASHNNCHLLSQQLVILFHNNCHLERSTIVGEANNCVESKDPYSSISVEVASGSSPQNADAFPAPITTQRSCYLDESFRRVASAAGTSVRRKGTIAPFEGSAAAEARASTSC
jgi:hypothetical protein